MSGLQQLYRCVFRSGLICVNWRGGRLAIVFVWPWAWDRGHRLPVVTRAPFSWRVGWVAGFLIGGAR